MDERIGNLAAVSSRSARYLQVRQFLGVSCMRFVPLAPDDVGYVAIKSIAKQAAHHLVALPTVKRTTRGWNDDEIPDLLP